jgi:hypothetical protein
MTSVMGRPRKYPSWTDDAGQSRAFTSHPNWSVCREVLRRIPDEFVCPEWLDLVAFVYDVAALIGCQPSKRHRLETVEPSQVFAPDTVLWWCPPRAVARHSLLAAVMRRHRAGDANMMAIITRLATDEPSPTAVRRLIAAEQRYPDDCNCTRLWLCDDHEQAARAGDDHGHDDHADG